MESKLRQMGSIWIRGEKKNKNKNNSQNWQDIAAAVVADRGGEICCGFKHGPEVGDGEAERGHWGD